MILLHVNNKCADQLVHPCSLIGTFVVRSFESTISIFNLVSVTGQVGLSLNWSQTLKPGITFCPPQ